MTININALPGYVGTNSNLPGISPSSITAAAYTLSTGELVCKVDTTSNAVVLTLPSPATLKGIPIVVKKVNAGTNGISLARNASEKIETVSASYTLPNSTATGFPFWEIVSDGVDWFVVGGTNAASATGGGASPLATFPSYGTIVTSSYFSDFLANGTAHAAQFAVNQSGTGAGASTVAATTGRVGLIALATGTTSTGYCAIWGGNQSFLLSNGAVRFRSDVSVPTASDGTDTFTCRVGLTNTAFDATAPANAVMFRYTHSVNSGKWECVTRAGGTETATDSGIAGVSASYQALEFQVNAAGTSVAFYVNGALVATNTTNIPIIAGREVGPTAQIIKSLGTTSRALNTDNMALAIDRTAAI